ncbi:MAG: NAD(P)-dependent oxidoreductase [Magnetococcales bacterium]|nr:NAD(P)-dependent oxidoreductase [Magnetococcales bacterium]
MKHVGVIGLGIMGEPMARNLAQAGFELSVWNRTPSKADALVAEGAHLCADPVQLVQQTEAIVIMVSGSGDLLAIVEQLITTSLQGKTIINVSTVSPEATMDADAKVRSAGGRFLDAPVSGSKGPAIQGKLVFLVGGDAGDSEACRYLFDAMGSKVVLCGPVGGGTRMKLAINLLLGTFMQGLAESMRFVKEMGLDEQIFIDVATSGAMAAPMVSIKGSAIAAGDYSPQFPLRHLDKDMNLVLEEAARCGSKLPMGATVQTIVNAAMTQGLGDEDICTLYKVQ